jgi:segregation and condensation protein B
MEEVQEKEHDKALESNVVTPDAPHEEQPRDEAAAQHDEHHETATAVEEQTPLMDERTAYAVTEEYPITEDDFDSDDVLIAEAVTEPLPPEENNAATVKAVIEAAIYITDEPLSAEQIAIAIEQPLDRVKEILAQLVTEYASPDRGLSVREVAGGYKMATKPEHHESIRRFVKGLQAPLKLSLAALETLAVIAYRQPITGPEVLDIRGVQGAGVLKTLLDRKLIAAAGRKNVLGKPMMYKTTREFLIQFGLNTLAELPTLKEFEELGRMALSEMEDPASASADTKLEAQARLPIDELALESDPQQPVDEAPPVPESHDA